MDTTTSPARTRRAVVCQGPRRTSARSMISNAAKGTNPTIYRGPRVQPPRQREWQVMNRVKSNTTAAEVQAAPRTCGARVRRITQGSATRAGITRANQGAKKNMPLYGARKEPSRFSHSGPRMPMKP